MRNKYLRLGGILLFLVLLSVLLLQPTATKAGIFNASSEVTYKEYWVPHSQYTGGCGEDERPPGSWYLEPFGCDKILTFQIPDDFSQALKAEIYVDLWRNKNIKRARFTINDFEVHAPNVGSDWSRTPYVAEIDLAELKQGANSMKIWGGGYHIHDIAFRIYYDDAHPLIAGSGSDVTPPDGSLLTIQGDGLAIAASSGGKLQVDNNQLTLIANVSNGAKYVEFHSYYFGYDEDNDGKFRDWHNRGRNNWFPGGVDRQPTGGTIDHAGTVATPNNGQYLVNWDVASVPDQAGVKFKIRVVDDAGNVREAAGGISNQFSLFRTNPKIAFWDPTFTDAGLYMDNKEDVSAQRDFRMPTEYVASNYVSAKMMHSFWHFGVITNLNDSTTNIWPRFQDGDHWQMSVRSFSPSLLVPWINKVVYTYNTPEEGRPGAFVEKPGPMFILERAPWVIDNSAPSLYNPVPAPKAVDVNAGTAIQTQVFDDQSGIDYSTIAMKVQGKIVSPTISGAKHSALVSYHPTVGFEYDEIVEVVIEACDLNEQCAMMEYSFEIERESLPPGFVSDDFNSCTLDDTVWEFRDPVGDSSYTVNGKAINISVIAGSNHDLWQNALDAPRIMQPANDADFRIRTHFNSAVEERFQLQGIIVGKDDLNFLRFSMRHDGNDAYLEVYIFENGAPQSRLNLKLDESLSYTVPTEVMVERITNTWKYLYLDENREWKEVKRFDYNFEVTEVGIFAGNKGNQESAAPSFTSSVDFFFDDNDPIDPQDQDPLFLPVEVVGSGTVQKSPTCGNPVTLVADAAEGYFFDGWSSTSGNITGRTNPLDTSFTISETVTATFRIDELSLIVKVENEGTGDGGSVTITPDQEIYNFEDQVVLTPNVPTGWDFEGWSGDIDPGDENKNPLIITMDDDLDITATFAAEPVTLQIEVDGMGSVDADPDQSGDYHYGDVVSLLAIPDSGWIFDHWEKDGAVSPENNPGDFTLNGNTEVTAVFEEYSPLIFLPTIMKTN